MKIKIKKVSEKAVIPQYAKDGDAGMDLTAISKQIKHSLNGDHIIEYGTGLAIEIPCGYVGLIFPRSSIYKKDLRLSNAVGVIDSGYRGEIKFKFKSSGVNGDFYEVGDRVGQIVVMPYPKIEFDLVDELNESERGNGGFGSSGN